jgi:hypothetical protein
MASLPSHKPSCFYTAWTQHRHWLTDGLVPSDFEFGVFRITASNAFKRSKIVGWRRRLNPNQADVSSALGTKWR